MAENVKIDLTEQDAKDLKELLKDIQNSSGIDSSNFATLQYHRFITRVIQAVSDSLDEEY